MITFKNGYTKLSYTFDKNLLKLDLNKILQKYKYHPVEKQICMTNTENNLISPKDKIYEGSGSLILKYDWPTKSFIKKETILEENEFSNFNEEFKDTYFFEVYNQLKKEFVIGRFRLIKIDSKTCLSWHKDTSYRIHIPIITSSKCFFIIEDHVFNLKGEGFSYLLDTKKHHTAVNADSIINRVHLVISIDSY